MPLDLDKIRLRWAVTPWTNGRTRELADDIAAMLSELDRLRSELAAAQAGPVVEWYATTVGEAARVGMFWMGLGSGGWTLRVRLPYGFGAGELIEGGPETGPAGKSAAEAAYRRACGFPPQAAPVAPQVVRLHQAYEGTTTCLHCGKPMPWSEMDRCPRDSGFPTAPPCAG